MFNVTSHCSELYALPPRSRTSILGSCSISLMSETRLKLHLIAIRRRTLNLLFGNLAAQSSAQTFHGLSRVRSEKCRDLHARGRTPKSKVSPPPFVHSASRLNCQTVSATQRPTACASPFRGSRDKSQCQTDATATSTEGSRDRPTRPSSTSGTDGAKRRPTPHAYAITEGGDTFNCLTSGVTLRETDASPAGGQA